MSRKPNNHGSTKHLKHLVLKNSVFLLMDILTSFTNYNGFLNLNYHKNGILMRLVIIHFLFEEILLIIIISEK